MRSVDRHIENPSDSLAFELDYGIASSPPVNYQLEYQLTFAAGDLTSHRPSGNRRACATIY